MKLSIKAGATSQTINVFVRDSSSTTGAGLTGLVYNSASLVAYYALPKAAAVQITLATLAAITTAWSSGGFKEVDATNMPGWYRLELPDAALASGRFVSIHLKGATNMAPLPIEIELTATDNQSATAFITGVNSLTPPTNWNLESIDANGRLDISKILGTAISTPATAGILDVNVKNMNNVAATAITTIKAVQGLATDGVIPTVTTVTNRVTANTDQWAGGTIPAPAVTGVPKIDLTYILGTILTETAGLLAGGFKKFFNVASPTLTTAGIDQTGDSFARIGVAGAGLTNIDLPNQTMDITGNITGNLSGSVGSVTGNVGGSVASVVAGVTLAASAVQAIWDALTSALTTVGSIGKLLVDNINATITSRMATYTQPTGFLAATFPSGTVANTTNITGGVITTVTNLTNAPTAGDLTATMKASVTAAVPTVLQTADQVWDELIAGHLGAGSTGLALSTASAGGDPAAIADAVWDKDATGHQTQGTFGQVLGDSGADADSVWGLANTNLDATISSRTKPADTQARVTLVDTLTTYTGNTPQTGDGYALANGASGFVAIKAVVDAIKVKTDQLTFTIANKVDSAIVNAASFAQAAADLVWGTASRTLTAFGFSVTVGTNNDKTGYTLSAAGIQAVWDALTTALTTVGSIGKLLVDNINATISSRSTLTQAQILSDATPFPGADIDAAISSRLATASYTAPPTAAANADAVWDEAIAGHLTAGSTGLALNSASSAGDPWATALPGVYGVGTAGKIVGDNLDATISGRASAAQATAIQADTDDIQTRLPAALSGGKMDSTLSSGERDAIATALLDLANAIETGETVRQALRLIAATTVGKLSGAGTGTEVFRNSVADSKNRVTATVDASGNRTAVATDAT